jgi:hypothetical protein
MLYSDVIPWLMERDAPSVRYWMLSRLLDRVADEGEVVDARQANWGGFHHPAVYMAEAIRPGIEIHPSQ